MVNAKLPAICVFCGASKGNSPEFVEAARSLGRALARNNRTLIYGGGTSGLMGQVAGACREAGGQITGVMPRAIAEGGGEGDRVYDPVAMDHPETVIVETMHDRKRMMAELADGGFVGLPGGLGTFEEVLEAVSWTALGIHEKPVVLLNVRGYYDPLKQLFSGGLNSGFIAPAFSNLLSFVDSPEDAVAFDWGEATLEALKAWKKPGGLFKNWNVKKS